MRRSSCVTDVAGAVDGPNIERDIDARLEPQVAEMQGHDVAGLAGRRDQVSRGTSASFARTRKPETPAPASEGVVHLTNDFAGGQIGRRRFDGLHRGGWRVVGVAEIHGQKRRVAGSRLAAMDVPIGKVVKRELLALSRPLGTGVVEQNESVADARHAGATRADRSE